MKGLPGYASNFVQTLQLIRDFARARECRRIITYGTSMGGLPALRAGLWLNADRAISVGGRFHFHPARLVSAQHEVPAFDLLCDCRPEGRTSLLAVYSKTDVEDARNYAILRKMLPKCVAIETDAPGHVAYEGFSDRERADFFAQIFGQPLEADCIRPEGPERY